MPYNRNLLLVSHHRVEVYSSGKPITVYPSKINFPNSGEVRKIILSVKLEYEFGGDDMSIVDRVMIVSRGRSFEIARLVPPYASTFRSGWNFTWEIDVTHFSTFLRDDVEVIYNHHRLDYRKSDKPYKVTLSFEITNGDPINSVVSIHPVYNDIFSVDSGVSFTEKKIKVSSDTQLKLLIYYTLHGKDNDGCPELCKSERKILVNDKIVESKSIFKNCSNNPVAYQSGDWSMPHANWCPGSLLRPEILTIERSSSKDEITVAFDADISKGKAIVSVYLMEYKRHSVNDDATLLDIVSPSTKDVYKNLYPYSGKPVIRVKNNGNNAIQSLLITYYFEYDKPNEFYWENTLQCGQEKLIRLPKTLHADQKQADFFVELSRVNNKNDHYPQDNISKSIYVTPDIFPTHSIIYYRTNKKPSQNDYRIEDSNSRIVFYKKGSELKPRTIYRNDIRLTEGDYTFVMTDSRGNGLMSDVAYDEGHGVLRFVDTLQQVIKHINPNFGNSVKYSFRVRKGVDYNIDHSVEVSVFPKKTTGLSVVEVFFDKPGSLKVLVTDTSPKSKILESHRYSRVKQDRFHYDWSYMERDSVNVMVYKQGLIIHKATVKLTKKEP